MTNDQILNIAAKTLRDGGGTFDEHGHTIHIKTGFAVSLKGGFNEAYSTLGSFVDVLKEGIESLPAIPEAYIGTWVDNGQLYVDRTVILNNEVEAVKLAAENNQLAIYDFEHTTSIPVMLAHEENHDQVAKS